MYVNDIFIIGRSLSSFSKLQRILILLSLKSLGHLDYFVGIEIKQLPSRSLFMTQSKYIYNLIQKNQLFL